MNILDRAGEDAIIEVALLRRAYQIKNEQTMREQENLGVILGNTVAEIFSKIL